MKTTQYFGSSKDGKIQCRVCPHGCLISDKERGLCGSFENQDGVLYAMRYAKVAAAAVDPIEKKPLFHFFPGSSVFSVAQQGCNLRCQWCQNHLLSQATDDAGEFVTTEELVRVCETRNHTAIAFTYSEPLIWIDYIRDFAEIMKNKNPAFSIVIVTNGYINHQPLHDILPYIDAFNVDIKSMNADVYHRYIGGDIKAVLRTVKDIATNGTHLEITNLIIPTINDTAQEMTELVQWIAGECGSQIPLHLSRYRPSYLFTEPATPIETIERAYNISREYLSFVYTGNMPAATGHENTYCPSCGALLIEREQYSVHMHHIFNGICDMCGSTVYGKFFNDTK